MEYKSLKDMNFGRLTVLYYDIFNKYHWVCECSCGKKTSVKASSLKSGGTKSCGCLRDEKLLVFSSLEYIVWKKLKKDRRVSIRWKKSFENFIKDVGRPPNRYCSYSIDFPKKLTWIDNLELLD